MSENSKSLVLQGKCNIEILLSPVVAGLSVLSELHEYDAEKLQLRTVVLHDDFLIEI